MSAIQRNITVHGISYTVEYPDKCPICHHYGDIQQVSSFNLPKQQGVEVVFQCPYPECQRNFIGYYGPAYQKRLLALKPQEPEIMQFPDVIKELSPQFIAIYKEAETARAVGLTQITGPAYRKAFEFLVKDYAKSLSPDKAEQIEKAFSGTVVNDYITNPQIQAVAKRALWLGNDESHYLRKWTSHDINDLLVLIKLTIDWIEIVRLSESYSREMPESKS